MRRNKVLALILTLCLLASMTLPAFAAGTRVSSWPWASGSVVAEEVSTGSSGTLTLVEDETTVTEGTELRASTYVLTGSGSSASELVETWTAVPASSKIGDLAKSGETYYVLSDGEYVPVVFQKVSSGFFVKRTAYVLMANNRQIAYAYAISTLSSTRLTLYTKSVSEASATTMALRDAASANGTDDTSTNFGDIVVDGTTLKYYPVTLYNYETGDKSINDATHQLEIDQAAGTETYQYVAYPVTLAKNNGAYTSGNYYVRDNNGGYHVVTSITRFRDWSLSVGPYYYWTIEYTGGSETATNYDYVGSMNYTLYKYEASAGISAWNGIYFGGNSHGATVGGSDTYGGYTASYANWNKWTGNFDVEGQAKHGNKTYSGLVENNLNSNKDIVFTKTEAGIFTEDEINKDVYTNVGLPFVYENGWYTFDANEFGVFFHNDTVQGTSATPADNTRLYYSATPQSHNFSAQDGRTRGWFPFNDTSSVNTSDSAVDYFFGMKAAIPFSMTANGRINPNDNTSEPIVFSFSGDDDVWVFIDDILVLDIGGVRNGMNATIDFQANTWSITEMKTSINDVDRHAEDVNNKALSGAVFNDGETKGALNIDRTSFSETATHELTIFYLERGAGSSNCMIKFNLPMKDVVSVTKRATQSIDSNGAITPLTTDEQNSVNNIDFGFTLTKNGEPVANTNYNLVNANGQVLSTPSTDANGHFTLRNGQTAKFIGEIAADGAVYQVIEDIPNNVVVKDDGTSLYTFSKAIYSYGGKTANGFTVGENSYTSGNGIPQTEIDITTANSITSSAITAKGSTEFEDSLQFVCENYFNANLPNPSSRPVDDKIVIDYGLPVVIDALANDVFRGETIELTDVTGAQYGTASIENGKITYQLTKQLTGVEVLTYTAKVTGSGNEGTETTTASESKTANIYIIPATSMYYEENFSNLVTFSDGWRNEGTAQTDSQEPGVVGTVGDSPYGSDAAYLNDSGDSNGSSMYVNTSTAKANFEYTFTGTGTSFFARTTNNSCYIRVEIYSGSDMVYTLRRDTSYKTEDNAVTLYNVPVFTWGAETYGTYTVKVFLSGGNPNPYGTEFWLDGIRVINPLNTADENASNASAAYAADGEANMAVVTLREKLIQEAQLNPDDTISWNEGDNFVIFTDTDGAITSAEDYRSKGPKEEVYLNNGQSITFSLSNWDANSNRIYLGVKAPFGQGTVNINNNIIDIHNAVDCYYDITKYARITEVPVVDENGNQIVDADGNAVAEKIATFSITAGEGVLISVTNIKVTGNLKFVIVNQKDIDA